MARYLAVVLFCLSAFFLLSACDMVGCGEKCEDNGDCYSGYECLETDRYSHKACLPEKCRGCFSDGDDCRWTTPEDENCEFVACE